jgi:hypothetical protein
MDDARAREEELFRLSPTPGANFLAWVFDGFFTAPDGRRGSVFVCIMVG